MRTTRDRSDTVGHTNEWQTTMDASRSESENVITLAERQRVRRERPQLPDDTDPGPSAA